MFELIDSLKNAGFMVITQTDVNRTKQLKDIELEQFKTWLKGSANARYN